MAYREEKVLDLHGQNLGQLSRRKGNCHEDRRFRASMRYKKPFVDMFLFVPFWRGMCKLHKFRTYIPAGDRRYEMPKISGPEHFVVWQVSRRIFCSAMAMLGESPLQFSICTKLGSSAWQNCGVQVVGT